MPELPDVGIFRRRLEDAAAGRRATDVKVIDDRLLNGISARELERLVGRRIRSTERHGKHLIAELDDGSALVLHFGMTGTRCTTGMPARLSAPASWSTAVVVVQ
jgi:formamidopyrimidine-DNA glycosylase